MKAFKSYGQKPFSMGSLTKTQRQTIDTSLFISCGIEKYQWLFSVQEIFFSILVDASCRMHDVYYLRRGNLIDKCMGDWHFYRLMLKDVFNYTTDFVLKPKAVINRVFAIALAIPLLLILVAFSTAYFLAVFVFGLFVFEYGEYRTWSEIEKILSKGR